MRGGGAPSLFYTPLQPGEFLISVYWFRLERGQGEVIINNRMQTEPKLRTVFVPGFGRVYSIRIDFHTEASKDNK
jgi:hypothetical protein